MSNYNWTNGQFELEPIDDQLANELPEAVVEAHLDRQTEAHDAATEAQSAADAAIEVGDYEAAHELRETAEIEAEYAGSDDMLHGADAAELEVASEHQQTAGELESVQAELAQQGDYEAARDVAQEATNEMEAADQIAGGNDHSGQAELEASNMDWADWHQQQADDMLSSAVVYAEAGNADAADNHLDAAMDEQATADHYGDLGEHGNAIADTDYSSEVASNPADSYSIETTDTSFDSSTSDISTSDDFTV